MLALGAGDCADELARERGDAGEAAEEIQQRPLADEQVAGRAGESATTVPAATSSPSAASNSHVDRGVHFVDQ